VDDRDSIPDKSSGIIFPFATASRLTLGPTQTPKQWVPGALSPGVKRPKREVDHSPPSRAWGCTSTPH